MTEQLNYAQVATAVYQACANYDQYLPEPTRPVMLSWAKVFQLHNLTVEDLLAAVDKLYAERESGFKPLPADIANAARVIRQDRSMRETPAARPALTGPDADRAAQARLEAIKALAEERAVEKALGAPRPVGSNYLTVACDHCKASVGQHCVVPGTRERLRKTPCHPSRLAKVSAA